MSINNTPVDVLQDQKWETVPWKKLQVGDIVKVIRFMMELLLKFLASDLHALYSVFNAFFDVGFGY